MNASQPRAVGKVLAGTLFAFAIFVLCPCETVFAAPPAAAPNQPLALATFGGNAHSQIAVDYAATSIDALLGKLEVTKKAIEINITTLRRRISELQTAKAKATVRVREVEKRVAPIQEELERVEGTMARLAEYIKAGKSVDLGEKSYDPEQLQAIASDARKRFEDLEDQVRDLESSKPIFEHVVETLDRRLDECVAKLGVLEILLRKYDAKVVEVNALLEASRALGGFDDTCAKILEQIKAELKLLNMDAERALRPLGTSSLHA